MGNPRQHAFTLIELLVVVTIIAILAALALPNFLEAQTRSKISAAKANLRNVAGALEAYAVDHGSYPATRVIVPGDPLAIYSDHQLSVLTTPISYTSPSAFRDPFGVVQASSLIIPRASTPGRDNFPELVPPNSQKSALYYHYPSMARRLEDRRFLIQGAAIVSIGPDLRDSLGAFRPFGADIFRDYFAGTPYRQPVDTLYDPTNGTTSAGDLTRYVGEAARWSAE